MVVFHAIILFLGCFWVLGVSAQEELFLEIRQQEDLRQFSEATFQKYFLHSSPWIRERAAVALGRIQDANSKKLLKVALENEEDVRVREALIFATGQLNEAEFIPLLLTQLQKDPLSLRILACEALGKIKTEKTPESAYLVVETALRESLRDLNPEIRATATLALFRQKATEALSDLIQAYSDPSPEVRWKIVYTLMQLKSPQTHAFFLRAIRDDNEYARLFAARGLKIFLDQEGTADALISLFQDRSFSVVVQAISSFQDQSQKIPESVLLSLLKHPYYQVRVQALKRLEEKPIAQAMPTIMELFSENYFSVREQALLTLTATAPVLGATYFEEFLDSPDPRDRIALLKALRYVPPERQERWRPLLRENKEACVRTAFFEQLFEAEKYDPLLLTGLVDKDLAVRGSVVGFFQEFFPKANFSPEQKKEILEALEKTYHQSQNREYYEIRELLLKIFREQQYWSESCFQAGFTDEFFSVRQEAYLGLKSFQKEVSAPLSPPTPLSPFLQISLPLAPKILMKTNRGEIKIKLFPSEAPIHTANMLQLIQKNFYQGLTIHRVVPTFVVQGGDPLGNGWGDPGYTLRDEINRVPYLRGTLGMPKAGKDTGGCQFFITHIPTPHLDGNYTVFGQVIEGFEVVDALEVGDSLLEVCIVP
ncbi:MAG: peptidylprolyl isomerase [Planctomycetota bacterium]